MGFLGEQNRRTIKGVRMMAIDELLIDFDEMGFVPTTLCENPDEYARDWKKQLLVEIKRLKDENKQLKTECAFVGRIARQDTIDVLNKVKEKLNNTPNGWAYTTYIDELIKGV